MSRTHYEGCFKDHLDCARAEMERLRDRAAELERLLAEQVRVTVRVVQEAGNYRLRAEAAERETGRLRAAAWRLSGMDVEGLDHLPDVDPVLNAACGAAFAAGMAEEALAQMTRERDTLAERMEIVLRAGPSTTLAVAAFDRARRAEARVRVLEEQLRLTHADLGSRIGDHIWTQSEHDRGQVRVLCAMQKSITRTLSPPAAEPEPECTCTFRLGGLSDDQHQNQCEVAKWSERRLQAKRAAHRVKLEQATPAAEPEKPRPPVACSSCRTAIRKFIPEGMAWHPCRDCAGELCERCCEKRKAAEPAHDRRGATMAADASKGLYPKYRVERLSDPNRKHATCDYYVLDLVHDRHARPALLAYAASSEAEYPELARDLRARAERIAPTPLPVIAAAPSPGRCGRCAMPPCAECLSASRGEQ